jgi:ribosomal protein S18 acetylase RimI-like enzyme
MARNTRAIRLYERLGFSVEGRPLSRPAAGGAQAGPWPVDENRERKPASARLRFFDGCVMMFTAR